MRFGIKAAPAPKNAPVRGQPEGPGTDSAPLLSSGETTSDLGLAPAKIYVCYTSIILFDMNLKIFTKGIKK